MTSSGIEHATFRLVGLCLTELCYHVFLCITREKHNGKLKNRLQFSELEAYTYGIFKNRSALGR
jgi:hypothetical protein